MKEKIINLSFLSVGILSMIILLVCFVEYILPVLLPFIIAWLVASVTVSPARKLSLRIKAPERVIRLVMSLTMTLFFVSLAVLLIWRATVALWSFLVEIGEKNLINSLLGTVMSKDLPFIGGLIPEEFASRINEAIGSLISSLLSALAGWVTSVAGGVPQLLFFLLVTVISLTYFSLDYDKISEFIKAKLPEKASNLISKLGHGIRGVLKKYVFSYSLIMLITYLTLMTGFLLLRVSHAAVIAFFIALLDILPVLGVGTVIVPWSIYELAIGNSFLGVGLILLFVVNAIIRQFCEPRIVGKNLDLHPVVTLMMLYIGYALFGIWGMLLLPVAAVCIGILLKGNKSTHVGKPIA